MSARKDLGIIFIVNFPLDEYNSLTDPEEVKQALTDLENGFFRYGQYIYSPKTSIYFITCFSGVDKDSESPNTHVTELVWDHENNRYKGMMPVYFGAVNLGNKDVMSSVLVYLQKRINAKKYVLFLFNHSSNFGFFVNQADDTSGVLNEREQLLTKLVFHSSRSVSEESLFALRKKQKTSNKHPVEIHQKLKKNIPQENALDYKQDMLTNSEFYVALYRAFELNNPDYDVNEKPIEVIFSAGCYFQNIDLAYTFRNFSNYLVGAEGVMPPQSFDYPAIINSMLEQINNSSKIDYRGIIDYTLRNFGDAYGKWGVKKKDDLLIYCAISSINCLYIDDLANALDKFVLYCFKNTETFNKIFLVRGPLLDLSNHYLQKTPPNLSIYDVANLFENLSQQNRPTALPVELIKIIENIQLCISKVLDITPFFGSEGAKSNYTGLSLYFPYSLEKALSTYNFTAFYSPVSRVESFFAKYSFWEEFLYFYFKLKDRGWKTE